METRPYEAYVYVGVGWRLIYQVKGAIDKASMKLQSNLILAKGWPVQEEFTTQATGPWDVEVIRNQADDLAACQQALDEKKEYSNGEGEFRLILTSEGKLTIIAGNLPQPRIHAEIPASEIVEFSRVVHEVLEFEEAVNRRKPDEEKGGKAIPETTRHPDKSGFNLPISEFTAYSGVGKGRRFSYEIEGCVWGFGLELTGGIQSKDLGGDHGQRWSSFGGTERMQQLADILKSCDKALANRKAFEKNVPGLRVSLSKNGLIAIRSGSLPDPFIDAEIPGKEAKVFAESLQSVVDLERLVNQGFNQK